jgi:hypothetical protein
MLYSIIGQQTELEPEPEPPEPHKKFYLESEPHKNDADPHHCYEQLAESNITGCVDIFKIMCLF